MAKDEQDSGGKKKQPIIVKRIKKGGDGHHGGAWKVAYADFVTAMMAFFLLLWLLNVTTEEQKNEISNYFDPTSPKVSREQSGSGGVLGGLSVAVDGAMTSDKQPPVAPPMPAKNTATQKVGPTPENMEDKALRDELERREQKKFEEAKDKIEQAIQKSPELKEMAKNLLIDITPEGLRIQIVDQQGKPMFPSGSAQMYDNTRALIAMVAGVIKDMPNQISIRGHTDAVPYSRGGIYTNWELSADRANASRRVLVENAIPDSKIANVVGKADTDALIKEDPKDERNRRLSIILLRESLTSPATGGQPQPYSDIPNDMAPTSGPSRTEGRVDFP